MVKLAESFLEADGAWSATLEDGTRVSRLSHDPYFRRIKGCRSLRVAAVGGQRWQTAPSGWRSTWPDWSGIGEVEHPSEIVGTTDDQPLVVDLLQSPS